MPREKASKKATPSSQASSDVVVDQIGGHNGPEKDPFEEILKTADKSGPVTVDLIVALLKAQETSLRAYFDSKISLKDEEIEKLKEKNQLLEERLDEMEQYSRRNSIRISGVAETTDVSEFISAKLNIDVSDQIDRCHPVGKRNADDKPRPLLVKFLNYGSREKVLKGRSKLKGSGIYINEDLTKSRSEIASKCKSLKKEKKITNTWIRDGTIFVKRIDDRVIRINSSRQLSLFVSSLD